MTQPTDRVFPMTKYGDRYSDLRGLDKREYIATHIQINYSSYSQSWMERLVGRPTPSSVDNINEYHKFCAEFRAKLRVMEANALIAELNEPIKPL